ncbi:hypothetical protein [Longimicrobium sp.]|uniref:hypothetical protein n=1 Tax=Longimicrobium sp. TaxID=2029185 RepID=UPI002CD7874B|nr:hypothetical protein [Longimicrobium sp.]HSU12532.1 hypothetical protein [Longimicrobium sp.]
MKKSLLPVLVLSLTFAAVECRAQRVRNPWAPVNRDPVGNTLYFLKDSVVEEGNGVRVAWLRITYKFLTQHGMASGFGPLHDMVEMRYRFDCPGRRLQRLESRERMAGEIVHEHPANPDAPWELPNTSPVLRDAWRRVC